MTDRTEDNKKIRRRIIQVRVKPPRCNLCGKELDVHDLYQDFSIHKELGYGTIYDGADIHLRLCCNCMERLIGRCKISPIYM